MAATDQQGKGNWKTKAKDRRVENKHLKKRLAETRHSRDKWKDRAIETQAQLEALKAAYESLKKSVF